METNWRETELFASKTQICCGEIELVSQNQHVNVDTLFQRICHEPLKYNVTQRSTSTMRLHIQKKHSHLWEDGHSSSSGNSSVKKAPARGKRKQVCFSCGIIVCVLVMIITS